MNIEEKRQIATAWFRSGAVLDAEADGEKLSPDELSAIVATHVPFFEVNEHAGATAFAVLKDGEEEYDADCVIFIDDKGVVVDEIYLAK